MMTREEIMTTTREERGKNDEDKRGERQER